MKTATKTNSKQLADQLERVRVAVFQASQEAANLAFDNDEGHSLAGTGLLLNDILLTMAMRLKAAVGSIRDGGDVDLAIDVLCSTLVGPR